MLASNKNKSRFNFEYKEEVSKIIMYLKNSSPGWDHFNSNVIKDTSDLLSLPLTQYINVSITRVFPDEPKIFLKNL